MVDNRPGRYQVTTLGTSFTPISIYVTKQYNLVPVKGQRRSAAGKVTVGLALHWLLIALYSIFSQNAPFHTIRLLSTTVADFFLDWTCSTVSSGPSSTVVFVTQATLKFVD